jgi:ribonuclease HII
MLELPTDNLTIGCDEVARGVGYGDVVAAAVILDSTKYYPEYELIKDSKKLSAKKRQELYDFIIKNAIATGIGSVSSSVIDEINILQATYKAMHIAIDNINQPYNNIVVDGNRFLPYKNIPYKCIIQGDNKHLSIAAASIIAKVHRDNAITKEVEENPDLMKYGFKTNKGYLSAQHIKAIKEFGTLPKHRLTFLKNILN